MKTRYSHFLLFLLGFSLLVGGCVGAEKKLSKEEAEAGKKLNLAVLISQWDDSKHSRIVAYPAGRDKCIGCHSGYAFSKGITELNKLPEGRKVTFTPEPGTQQGAAAAGEITVAVTPTDCMACHTGKGLDKLKSGRADTPTKQNIDAGKSALCITCHNARKVPDINDPERSAPHGSAEADVFYGSNGIRAAGFQIKESGHLKKISNPCIFCHMPKVNNQAYHGFKATEKNLDQTCRKCHKQASAFNIKGKADYNGDGKTEGLQDEVAGLMDILKSEITKALNGGTFEAKGGKFTFKDAQGKTVQANDKIYLAAYNWYLIDQDGSKGIHNPTFTVQLLQQSYKYLTGKDVPNAKLK